MICHRCYYSVYPTSECRSAGTSPPGFFAYFPDDQNQKALCAIFSQINRTTNFRENEPVGQVLDKKAFFGFGYCRRAGYSDLFGELEIFLALDFFQFISIKICLARSMALLMASCIFSFPISLYRFDFKSSDFTSWFAPEMMIIVPFDCNC